VYSGFIESFTTARRRVGLFRIFSSDWIEFKLFRHSLWTRSNDKQNSCVWI